MCIRDRLLPPAKRVVLLLVASVNLCTCLCVCLVRALTFESLDLETSLLVWSSVFRISRPSSYVKVIGSRSSSHEPKNGIYERLQVVRLRLEGKLIYNKSRDPIPLYLRFVLVDLHYGHLLAKCYGVDLFRSIDNAQTKTLDKI